MNHEARRMWQLQLKLGHLVWVLNAYAARQYPSSCKTTKAARTRAALRCVCVFILAGTAINNGFLKSTQTLHVVFVLTLDICMQISWQRHAGAGPSLRWGHDGSVSMMQYEDVCMAI